MPASSSGFALNLYVASGITMKAFLMLVTYWPGLFTWFPKMLGMM